MDVWVLDWPDGCYSYDHKVLDLKGHLKIGNPGNKTRPCRSKIGIIENYILGFLRTAFGYYRICGSDCEFTEVI